MSQANRRPVRQAARRSGKLRGHLASANARSFERSRFASGVAVVTRLVCTDSITSLPPVPRPVLN